ncbi:Receptor-type tyrosine-protein phosphatase N2 [Liparis tanakae]|uniref:Receptor-type tyrosine-protein phosphatase N2 n=1 Tax=Liparis tanakae TaxID=230148 RepID=A0A4Z2I0G9_9TELE|nr:Receptor-type tyrosine-protein phosphatase N2 [Liparis tanakae]
MASPWRPVLLAALAASLCSSAALADRKFDGVFGRCQELAAADLYTYDVSSSALQRLRILLQKLAHRGLTWQDDLTQQVISRELSKLRTIPLRHQSSAPRPPTAYSSSRDGKLSRNLQQYLTGLGLLPQSEVDGKPGIQRLGANAQKEDIKSEGHFEPSRLKPQQGWKETTIYSHHKGAGQPPVTKVFTQSGEGRHPKLSTSYSNRDPGGSKLLKSHLEQLLADVPSTQQGAAGGKSAWPKEKLHYLSYIRPAPNNNAEPQSHVAFSSKTPNLDRLTLKAGSNRLTDKEPLNIMDERFIQNMVNQLGRHSINMEALMGKDLDQLAGVITGALQEVHEERPAVGSKPGPGAADSGGGVERDREPLAVVQPNQDKVLKSDKGQDLKQEDTLRLKQHGQQIGGADKEPVDKHAAFFSKLLDYLNLETFGDAPKVNVGPPAPIRKMSGLENVQSRTTQGQVPVPQRWEAKTSPAKEGSILRLTGGPDGPGAQVDSEIQRWMQGNQDPAGKKQEEEPQKKDMRIKTQLVHVGVKEFSSRGKDRHFGYIITGSEQLRLSKDKFLSTVPSPLVLSLKSLHGVINSLTADQGSDLMERLTERLHLHAADLTQLSYVQTQTSPCMPTASRVTVVLAVHKPYIA